MVELEKVDEGRGWAGGYGALWASADRAHVISEEDGRYWVRDESGALGDFPTFSSAFEHAEMVWGATLAPANRLARDVAEGRPDEVGQFLIEYLAEYGAVGIDVRALANLVLARIEDAA